MSLTYIGGGRSGARSGDPVTAAFPDTPFDTAQPPLDARLYGRAGANDRYAELGELGVHVRPVDGHLPPCTAEHFTLDIPAVLRGELFEADRVLEPGHGASARWRRIESRPGNASVGTEVAPGAVAVGDAVTTGDIVESGGAYYEATRAFAVTGGNVANGLPGLTNATGWSAYQLASVDAGFRGVLVGQPSDVANPADGDWYVFVERFFASTVAVIEQYRPGRGGSGWRTYSPDAIGEWIGHRGSLDQALHAVVSFDPAAPQAVVVGDTLYIARRFVAAAAAHVGYAWVQRRREKWIGLVYMAGETALRPSPLPDLLALNHSGNQDNVAFRLRWNPEIRDLRGRNPGVRIPGVAPADADVIQDHIGGTLTDEVPPGPGFIEVDPGIHVMVEVHFEGTNPSDSSQAMYMLRSMPGSDDVQIGVGAGWSSTAPVMGIPALSGAGSATANGHNFPPTPIHDDSDTSELTVIIASADFAQESTRLGAYWALIQEI